MSRLLTIAIPTYNRANLLDKQLTWLAQAIKGFEEDCEVFISDNCSTDHTQDIIKKWQLTLGNIPFTNNKNSENIGLRNNISFCINSAKTKYVWTVGDDDPIRETAISYVLTTIRKHDDLSLLFLNFSGHDITTGETTGAWFDTAANGEDIEADGKEIFEDCFYKNQNAVIFITASVYRTERAQEALRTWKNATDNWLYLAYVAGYCALTGRVIVSPQIYLECVIGVSHWQADSTAPLYWRYKHIPEVIMKLKELGYSKNLYNRMIIQNFIWNLTGNNQKYLVSSFKRWPLLTVKIFSYFCLTMCIADYEKIVYFKDTEIFMRLTGEASSLRRPK